MRLFFSFCRPPRTHRAFSVQHTAKIVYDEAGRAGQRGLSRFIEMHDHAAAQAFYVQMLGAAAFPRELKHGRARPLTRKAAHGTLIAKLLQYPVGTAFAGCRLACARDYLVNGELSLRVLTQKSEQHRFLLLFY